MEFVLGVASDGWIVGCPFLMLNALYYYLSRSADAEALVSNMQEYAKCAMLQSSLVTTLTSILE